MKVVEEKLRSIVAGELAQQLTTGAADRAEQFGAEIATELDKFRDTIDDGLAVRIEELRSQLQALLDDRNRDRAELHRRQTELDTMETQLDALDDGIAILLAGLGPALLISQQG
jgi:hypothetical protein